MAAPQSGARDANAYLAFYGLRDAPFRSSADPHRLWLGRARRAVLGTLARALQPGGGVAILTGGAGVGKTSLVSQLIDSLRGESAVIGRIRGPLYDMTELPQAAVETFGSDVIDPDEPQTMRFTDFVDGVSRPGSRAVLIVDEAQSLSDDLLRAMFDRSTGGADGRAMAVLLVGGDELTTALSREHHAALRQRITAQCVLEPLTVDEVADYIDSRIRRAGGEEPIFDARAVQLIARLSRGAPGMIDVIGEQALREGHARGARTIVPEIVEDSLGAPAAPSVPALTPPPKPARARVQSRLPLWAIGITVFVVALAAFAALRGGGWFAPARQEPAAPVVREAPAPAPPAAPPAPVESAPPAPTPPAPTPPAPNRSVGRPSRPPAPGVAPPSAPQAPPRTPAGPRPGPTAPAAPPPARDTRTPEAALPSAPPASLSAREPPKTLRVGEGRPAGGQPASPADASPDVPTKSAPPRPAPARERPATGDTKGEPDPGAIIDWLLKDSGSR